MGDLPHLTRNATPASKPAQPVRRTLAMDPGSGPAHCRDTRQHGKAATRRQPGQGQRTPGAAGGSLPTLQRGGTLRGRPTAFRPGAGACPPRRRPPAKQPPAADRARPAHRHQPGTADNGATLLRAVSSAAEAELIYNKADHQVTIYATITPSTSAALADIIATSEPPASPDGLARSPQHPRMWSSCQQPQTPPNGTGRRNGPGQGPGQRPDHGGGSGGTVVVP